MSIDITPTTDSLDPTGRVAVVGAGAFGRFCIDTYTRSGEFDVVAVADPDPAALARVRAPGTRLEGEWRALLLDDTIEVIHLATPPRLRGEIAFSAMRAGKSVFCEKPIALSLAEADAMIEAAENAGVGLGVNYVMRHLPAYRILEQLSTSGVFGNLRSVSFQNFAQALSPTHWFWDQAASGGIFVEHGVHFFDAYGRIAGAPIQVRGSTPRPEAVEATISYATNVIGRYYHEFAFPIEIERTVGLSFFERGYVEIEGWIPTKLTGAVLASPDDLQNVNQDMANFTLTQEDHVTRFLTEFGDREASYERGVILGMRDLVLRQRNRLHTLTVSARDARASLALALACRTAAESEETIELQET